MVASIVKKRIKGFTLVEMTLYVGVCSLLLFSISLIFGQVVASRIKSQAITEVNQQGIFLMSLMTNTVRNGKTIDTPSIGSASSTLAVTVQDSFLSPTVFSLSSTTLMIREGASSSIPITNNRVVVSSLLFDNISSSSGTDRTIKITFTLSYNSQNPKTEYSYSKVFTGSATLRQ